MRKGLPFLLSVFLLTAAGNAYAADARGDIAKLDKDANVFQLDSGIRFSYDAELDETQLVEGARVKVTYKQVRGKMRAQRVRVISTPQG